MAVLVKNPARAAAVTEHIVSHFGSKVEPHGFKAQAVVFDRECCVLYKEALDKLLGPDASAVVMHVTPGGPARWKAHGRGKDEEEKLLTGFDAPILQAMYLDKPMKDYNLLQAICRTNRLPDNDTRGAFAGAYSLVSRIWESLSPDPCLAPHKDSYKRTVTSSSQRCMSR